MNSKLKESIQILLWQVQNVSTTAHEKNVIDEAELNKYYYCLGYTKALAEVYEHSHVLTLLKNLDGSIEKLLNSKRCNANIEAIVDSLKNMRENLDSFNL